MVILDKRYIKNGFTGLYNLGNTCYINSVIVSLSNTMGLTLYFLEPDNQAVDSEVDDKKKYIFFKYINLLIAIWENNDKIKPKSFRTSISEYWSKYNNGNSQDAQEFLLDFLGILEECTRQKCISINVSDFSSKHYKDSSIVMRNFTGNSKSIINDTFIGQYLKSFKCSDCQKETFNYDPFMNLMIEITGESSVSKLLHNYFDIDYTPKECCNGESDLEHSVTTFIYKLPETLIISLKRFDSKLQKNSLKVTIDEMLDLSRVTFTNSSDSVCYELSSVIYHLSYSANNSGKNGLSDGHYVTVIRRNGGYFMFDDHKITKLKELPDFCSYILFYNRMNSK
jgi:ubiquitin C-terminal hydrolase